MMAKMALAYPSLRLSDQEAGARVALYAEQLSDLPAETIGLTFQAAVRTCKFFPSIAELRELAKSQPSPARVGRHKYLKFLISRS